MQNASKYRSVVVVFNILFEMKYFKRPDQQNNISGMQILYFRPIKWILYVGDNVYNFFLIGLLLPHCSLSVLGIARGRLGNFVNI